MSSLAFSFALALLSLVPGVLSGSYGIPFVPATYDYVVVGGGTSGLTLAARLAANSSILVAVVEAGGSYETLNPLSDIPGFAAIQATGTDPSDTDVIDWGFVTTPQAGAANRKMHYARGKCLGGSSARHFLVYHRGTKGSYQKWADQVGDDSYAWDNFLPYFEKSCTLTPPNTTKRFANATVTYDANVFDNSLGGPLQISWPNWASPLSSWVEIGLAAIGVKSGNDHNSGSLTGSSWIASTINPNGEARDSSETSFLKQAMANTNITVYSLTMAKKILFKSTNIASGVQVEQAGAKWTLTARKEVIISAGAFQSPQLLMVSGIGPRATLEGLGIPVISELAGVGQNMWDHVFFGTVSRIGVTTASRLTNDVAYAAQAVVDYASGTGLLTANGVGVIGWEKLPDSVRSGLSSDTITALNTFPSDWPEVEYMALDGVLGYWRNALNQFVDSSQYGSVGAALVAPLSRGNVTITSTDTKIAPVINPNWLTHPADVEVALAAFKRTREVWDNVAVRGTEYLPGSNVTSDADLLDFIRNSALQVWHASATCAMGKSGDPKAVVDSTAKVFGVKGLRVVDASIFPLLPPGHPQSTCYALGEKIADDILKGR
ncbi:alcohol oxidase [Mytilinidion resinicola]|uniref:Alcohol oxidase n=1 Tax=Mytilinidion resinicola TaxID=574789 RepID=A0A6A6Y552_9PEZI|nr:alcohol oxidase [Mytilinidion resinicola]KAF2803922.1 alcohol oxidase [Mytilinidion resinicola]